MKKIFCLTLVCILTVFIGTVAFAEGGIDGKGIYLDVFVEENADFKAEDITFSLYSPDGEKLADDTFFLFKDNRAYELYFDVEFVTGDKFLLELTMGGKSFKAYDSIVSLYNNTMLETYASLDEEGNVVIGNRFSVNFSSDNSMPMDVYINGRKTSDDDSVKVVNGVPFCEMHKLKEFLYFDKDSLSVEGDNVTIKNEEKSVAVTVGSELVTYGDGRTDKLPASAWYDGQKTYVPVAPFAKELAADYKEIKSDFALDIDLYPQSIKDVEEFVMKNGIDSKTDYMIWISKKDFKLHLFNGSKGNWHLIDTFPCTIGAPSTPTITGQYDYIEKIPKWYYPKYYVGPVMRFHNGYAIHTVLLKNDGTEYDGRVGMKLSLGCIRVKKDVMEYLVKEVPMRTKIYITD